MAVFPSDSIRTKNWGTEILTDSDLEAQLDLLHAYFTAALNSTTGHSHDGTSNQGPLLTTLGTVACINPINFKKGADIASATTTNIGAATGNCVDVTGTTTITGLGTVQAGTVRFVRFTGALLLTYNATSLILPSSADITTAAGDTAIFESLGSGNWVCLSYQRRDGTPITGATAATSLSGSVIQYVLTEYTAADSTTNAIPYDDTAPLQASEGKLFMSKAFTPKRDDSIVLVKGVCTLASTAANPLIAFVSKDSGDALAVFAGTDDGSTQNETVSIPIHYKEVSGSTSARTYNISGGAPSGTTTFNGSGGARKFGATTKSYIEVWEIRA